MKSFIFFFFSLTPLIVVSQGSPDKINMAWFYNPDHELQVDLLYSVSGSIDVRYTYKEPASLSVYFIAWESVSSNSNSINELLTTFCTEKDCILTIPGEKIIKGAFNTLIIRDEKAQQDYVLPLEAEPAYKSPVRLRGADGEWISDRSIAVGTPLKFETLDDKAIVHVYYYNDDFDAAAPPTGARSVPSASMMADSVFQVFSLTTFIPERPGLYLLQTDSLSLNAYAFRVYQGKFPDYGSIKELTPPMIYLTTSQEWKALNYPSTRREDFEKVWLSMAGSDVLAGAAIKYFYRGITGANRLFTTYKEGWKTDMGMVYSVFGPPDGVFVTGGGEVWVYNATENHSYLEFSFIRSPVIFSPYHRILQRKNEYSLPWNRTVDRLRRGTPNHE